MIVKRLIPILVLAVAGLLVPSTATAEEPPVRIEGGGYGHGVGMPQYGAYGQALLDGASATEILEYYYTGTSVKSIEKTSVGSFLTTEEYPLWVGLFQDDTKVTFSPEGGNAALCYGGSDEPNCDLTALAGETWQYQFTGTVCRFNKKVDGAWQPVAGSETPKCGASATPEPGVVINLVVLGTKYKNGILRIREDVPTSSGDTTRDLHAIWQTGVQDYLFGLAEMPDSWGVVAAEALRAQAIAARTYGVRYADFYGPESDFTPTRKGACWCHLYDDTRSQVFGGWTSALAHPNMVAAARASVGLLVTYDNEPIQAFYSSSTFGHTENSEDVFSAALPYLRSVPDRWSVDPAVGNPRSSWEKELTKAQWATKLGWSRIDKITLLQPAAGALVRVSGEKSAGIPQFRDYRGADLRTPLGLWSPQVTWISAYSFLDIEGNFHAANIQTLFDEGVTKGCGGNLYCPSDLVTRAQMASFLARALALPPAPPAPFTDDDGSVHEANISRLYAAGITLGCTETLFCPNDPISRAHVGVLLVRAIEGLDPLATPDAFTDDDGRWFEPHLNALAASGISNGCAAGLYCPDDFLRRDQMASLLVRAIFSS